MVCNGTNRQRYAKDVRDEDVDYVILNEYDHNNSAEDDDNNFDYYYGRSNRRANYTKVLEEKGIRRPVFATVNSRA
jgi:hypothetical protein